MSPAELGLCLSSLACSSASQLFMKGAMLPCGVTRRLATLGVASGLMLTSVGFAVLALQTLGLSQLIPFAAGAHLLVPVGSSYLYGERIHPRFWIGALLIVSGILCTQS